MTFCTIQGKIARLASSQVLEMEGRETVQHSEDVRLVKVAQAGRSVRNAVGEA